MKFSEFYLCFTVAGSSEICYLLSRIPIVNRLWSHHRKLIMSISLKKSQKKAVFFKLFRYKVFVQ